MSPEYVRGPLKKTRPRYGVVGHESLGFAEAFPWQPKKLPNLIDFYFLIVDLTTVPDITHLRFERRQLFDLREKLYRQVFSGGTCIFLLDDPEATFPLLAPDGQLQQLPVQSLIPLSATFSKETGRSITTLKDTAREYLKTLNEWHFRFIVGGAFPYLDRPDANRWATTGDHILVDREGWALASEIQIGQGRMLVLPHVPSFPTADAAVAAVFESVTGIPVSPQLPSWASSVGVGGTPEIEAEIARRRGSIEKLAAEIVTLNNSLETKRRVLGLVCLDGKPLEEIVREALIELGGAIKQAYSEDEYVLELGGAEYVVEVKGATGSAKMPMLGQIMNHRTTAEERAGKAVGALLVVNAYRSIPPVERGKRDTVQIPPNVADRAKEWGIPIVTGTQLLGCINATRAARISGLDALQAIVTGRGPIDLTGFGIEG